MQKKRIKKKRMIKGFAAALKAMENTVYEAKDRSIALKQVTEGLNVTGLDATWDWCRVIFAGRDASGAGWVTVMPKNSNSQYDSIWPEWAYGVADNALHFDKWLEVWRELDASVLLELFGRPKPLTATRRGGLPDTSPSCRS